MFDVKHIIVFTGQGPRRNRVHIFDRETGDYITRGFTRGYTLYVRRPIVAERVVLRPFDGRRTGRPLHSATPRCDEGHP